LWQWIIIKKFNCIKFIIGPCGCCLGSLAGRSCLTFGLQTSDKTFQTLEAIQRLAARTITERWDRDTCVTGIVDKLGLVPLQTRRRERRLMLLYRILMGETIIPAWKHCQPATYYGRHDHGWKLRERTSRSEDDRASLFPRTTHDWNELEEKAVNSETLVVVDFGSALQAMRKPITCPSHPKITTVLGDFYRSFILELFYCIINSCIYLEF